MDIYALLAREEIRNLRLAYATYFDRQDLDALIDLFTEDAVCDFGEGYGTWVGREAVREGYAREMARIDSPFDALHVVTNPWIEFASADEADARWYLIDLITRQMPQTGITTIGGHKVPLLFLGVYEDRCRKVEGRWRIARTRLNFLWPERPA